MLKPVKVVLVLMLLFLLASSFPAFSQNPIANENSMAGTAQSVWDISGAGDLSIQGFATEISVNKGQTVNFKIKSDAVYTVNIYRLGWYGGNGAREISSEANPVIFDATLPQVQPADNYITSTGMTDCSNWDLSAHWNVPANAVSGIYIAKLNKSGGGSSHIVFIVRDDAGSADILFKTSDATWQAYNAYGGNSLYVAGTEVAGFNHAVKVSYNRPFITRNGGGGGGASEDWLFNAEYPMVRWLERNGYNISYTTDVDMDKDPKGITPTGTSGTTYAHKVLLSVGHDEYWSAAERTKFENARNAGVHLAFFSGNEVYWKTRWEDNHRTLVCYKEGTLGENNCGGNCDPSPVWTGLWRDGDPAIYPGSDGGKPENSLTGQISWEDITGSIEVPAAYKNHRFWRNTAVASLADGATLTLPDGTLGYEWDWEQYQDYYPSGRITLSSTTLGGRTHKLSLYRHPSGALVFGAGTVQWSWGLDNIHDRGNLPASRDMKQATRNLFADMGVQPSTPQNDDPLLVAAASSTDVTDPVSVITYPAGNSSFPANTPVTITGTASEAGGGIVAGVDVSVDGGLTWKPATGTTSWTFNWTPLTQGAVTIKSRAFDDSGNIEGTETIGGNVIALTIGAPVAPICPCTIWSPSTVPANLAENDPNPVELGVKFRSNVGGYITGIRFYKSTLNTGTHTGTLWSADGTQLATATFINETASGWQQVSFNNPVSILPNTTYVASYHTPTGHYSYDNDYFAAAGFSSFYLEALQSAVDASNGVYAYSSTTTFPSSGYQSTNYWVDVVFELTLAPDVTPPTVVSVSPLNGSSGVASNVHPTAFFSEALNPASVNGNSVLMTGPGTTPVPGTASCSGNTVTFTPSSPLLYNTEYTMTLEGAYSTYFISDLAGNRLSNNYSWTFTTSGPPPPPPSEGPGGPILVISAASNPFSRYPVEILRAEGFNEFYAVDIANIGMVTLNDYDVIILGEFPLPGGFVTTLTNWVNAGGTLIAMRPGTQLNTLLGISSPAGTLSDQYLLVNTTSGPGVGIVDQTIQFHGTADLHTLNGATSLATLYSSASVATANPAVTQISIGANGGKAVAFTYDLARSVVYTRQGNPAWAGQERDGVTPLRSDDLFYPDWINLDKVAIPQADEQQRLLANIIIQGALHKMPLPRFWFLPKGLKAAIVMTGDDHGDAGMQPRFDADIAMSLSECSVDDWECIRSTGYLYVGNTFTNEQAAAYNAQGFETALHINTNCEDYTASQFESFLTTQMTTFTNKYTGIPRPSTNRNHCIAWSGWTTAAEVSALNGIRLDVNYYYWPNSWHLNRPGMFTGSGYPMRFAKLDGTIIDVYQVATQMQDETQNLPVTPFPEFSDALLDKAIGPEGYYGVFAANMHFDYANHAGANAIVNSAKSRGIPVVSAKQMLDWLDGRNASNYENIEWSANTLTFDVSAGAGARNLTGMVPVHGSGNLKLLSLKRGGSPVTVTTEVIKGISYAFFPALDGSYSVEYAVDAAGPVISNVVATPHADGTATITWTTDELSSSRVDYGLSSGALNLNVASATIVTAHSITLSGLNPSSTYYYRVTSVDDVLNSSSMPVSPAANSFNTPAGVCAQDMTMADFGQGTPDANTLVVPDGDGAVILKPGLTEEFNGAAIPSGWMEGSKSDPWSASGTFTYTGEQVILDGSHIYSTTTFGPGTSIEFNATFTAANSQYIGFSTSADVGDPWILIGRGTQADNILYARTYVGGEINVPLGAYLGAPHNYKIQWNSSGNFEFYVDGVIIPAATTAVTVSAPMLIQISDLNLGGGVLSVDRVRATPYLTPGSFTSRVFDAGAERAWGEVTWSADLPASATLSVLVHAGNTPMPDASWSPLVPKALGSSVGITSRYIQYRADLATGNTFVTPVLKDIAFSCTDPSLSPPAVALSPASQAVCDGVTVSFTSEASGFPVPTVQWEELSTATGASWVPVSGATTGTLSFTAIYAKNGYQYRALWRNDQSTDPAISPLATLTVYSPVSALLEAVDADICQSESIQLRLNSAATGQAPYTVVVNGVTYPNVTAGVVFATLETPEQSIWGAGDIPSDADGNDGEAIEVGVKFRSSVPGYVRGVRFYHGTYNTGTYTGKLWSANGTLLASAQFTNISSSGWQEVRFSTPVRIDANTTYIASYYSTSGYFAIRAGNLTVAKESGPLTALANGYDGPNGIYRKGDGSLVPNTSGNGSNYYADVVFSAALNDVASYTYNLTSVTDDHGCTLVGAPNINSVTVDVNPEPSGIIAPAPGRATVYEGEEYELVFNSTAGPGPFTVVINGETRSGIMSGIPFTAGPASYTPAPVTLFLPSAVGGTQTVDPNTTELGVIFNSSISGTISGIRFYVTDLDTELPFDWQFTTRLWDEVTGTLLATGTYNYDNTIGWKQVNFTTPVPVIAGRNYMASYVSPAPNHYAYTYSANYQPIISGPLTTVGSRFNQPPIDNVIPATGVGNNYWVDVVFNSTSSISTFNLTSVTGSGNCTTTGNPISSTAVTVNRARVWTGGTSSEWSNSANWSTAAVPGVENVVVPVVTAGNDYPIISSPEHVILNDLRISLSASLTVDAGAALTVNGNLANLGTLAIKSGLTGSDLTPSGSLIVRGASSGDVTYERKFKEWTTVWGTNNNFDWHYFSSPVGSNSNANPGKVSAVYSYDEVTGAWPLASMTALTSGIGYNLDQTAYGVSDELLTFKGTVVRSAFTRGATSPYRDPFDGTSYSGRAFASGRNISPNYGGGGWNLLGNPFTSAMNVAAFIDSNNGVNNVADDGYFDPNYEALYVYDGSIGDHGTYVIYNTGAIQAGQGFFVLAMNNGVSFTFTPADETGLNMQVHNTSTVLLKSAKAENPWPGLELKVKYGNSESSTSILYNDSMTPGLDPGHDIGQLSAGPAVEIYTSMAAKDNGVNFARQALPIAGADTIVVAVGIDSENGGEVTFSAKTVPFGNNKFWLEDRVTGIFTNLNTNTYTVTLPAKTYGTGRFYLKSGTTITSVKPPKEESGLRIWTSDGKVIIKGAVSEGSLCEIFDAGGRRVVMTRLIDSELNTVTLPPDSKGVYLVRVIDGGKVTTRKVAFF